MSETAGPLLTYLDAQANALLKHLPDALATSDADAIHACRVATRRAKSALAAFDGLTDGKPARKFARLTKKLRRDLGPLRDGDVMADALAGFTAAVGAAWLRDRVVAERESARATLADDFAPADALADVGRWWGTRLELLPLEEAALSRLRETTVAQAETFAADADELCAALKAKRKPAHDVHELRIVGKELRYALEIAAEAGHAVPKPTAKLFKRLQDDLGTWHDYAALAQRALRTMADEDTALHDAPAVAAVVPAISECMKRSAAALARFAATWSKGGGTLVADVRAAVPLTRAINESKTGRGPEPTASTSPPAAAPQVGPAADAA